MKKNKWIKIGILLFVFCLAVVIICLVINRKDTDQAIEIGEPTLPGITFEVQGRELNRLSGYVDEMNVTAMRDSVTPVASDGKLQMNLKDNELEILEINYKVHSLDGTEIYLEASAAVQNQVELELGGVLSDERPELVLQIVFVTENKNISYYTRIKRQEDLGLAECLKFAEDFHGMTFDTKNEETLSGFLEPNEESDNTTYQTVNIHSNAYHICWGDMAPEIVTDVEWSIKETNNSYTSLQAVYQVSCKNEEDVDETYNVKEFFRVRLSEGEMYLLDYNRTMNQVFDEEGGFLTAYSLVLGITDTDVEYVANKDGSKVSFIQERELWVYDKKKNEIIQTFSFTTGNDKDIRNRSDEHELKIISMDEDGNTMFAVYGYMNSGIHEGRVGVAVYYYDIDKNLVEEKAFIPSTKSFAIAHDELGKMIYCNQEQQILYVLANGVLYEVDLDKNEQNILQEGLEDGQYVVSEDGHYLAYQANGNQHTAAEVQVMNLASGESYTVQAASGEAIVPLGFVTSDFICGFLKQTDKGTTVTSEEIYPMYKMEILESADKVLKTYEQEGIYLSDVWVEDNLITLNRLTKAGNVYTGTSRDYITNTEEKRDTQVTLDIYTTELKEQQARLIFEEENEKLTPKVVKANLQVSNSPVTISFGEETKKDRFYVYGHGEMEGVYSNAAQAILKAEELSGVVVSSDQEYIWEKGNRDLGFYIECEPFGKAEGQTSLDACLKYMENYDASRMNLTGCSMSQIMYVLNRGLPVITMTSADHAILLVGYNWIDMYYIDPDTGAEESISQSEMSEITEAAGNVFIGYK